MEHIASERITWKKALKKEKPLLMPVAHDGLSARLIEEAGFTALQVGGFAVAFKGEQLATSVLENGGKTPWLPPEEFGDMGFTMILYPTTLLFRLTYALRRAAQDLRAGKPIDKGEAVDMKEFEKIVELEHWQAIEKRFQP